MAKWICPECDYTYDPGFAFLTCGVASGTQFGDLSDDWRCPQCGAGKPAFVPLNRADLPERAGDSVSSAKAA
jgi:rubredoxin